MAAAEQKAKEDKEREDAQKNAEEQAAKEKAAAEKFAAAEAKRAASEKEAREEAERAAKEQAERERAEKEETERLAAEAAEKERLAAEKAAQEEADRIAVEEAAKLAAEEEKQRLEAEERARQEELAAEQARLEAEEQAKQAALEAEQARLEEEAKAAAQPEPEPEEERREGWFKRMRKGLARSSSNLTENITSVFTKKKLDEDTLQDLEDILIQADLGVETAMNITDALASQRMGKDITDEEVRQVMADEIAKTLEPVAQPLELDLDHQPHVILVVGVNGSGKTTTIGKMSQKLYDAGFSTLLVAGDTFRAAAIEQLHIWGDRTQAPVMSRDHGADAAGLAFDAYAEAQAQRKDVMLMDTAGRLQNRKELMDELEKIIRVLKKQDPSAPHTVLLTLDATTGQNALNQVEIFKDVAGVNGLVMTKLDGTARGGILVAISAKHKLPVYFIGVGEQVEDLEPFEADVFAKAIAGLESS
ncbi:MAG: signal recognition particle-docking protein FtsY [Rhizobiaceae bacterium]|nr:signal recognition particle-docking protein FtsY [Rhizobiaceae bacterium]